MSYTMLLEVPRDGCEIYPVEQPEGCCFGGDDDDCMWDKHLSVGFADGGSALQMLSKLGTRSVAYENF